MQVSLETTTGLERKMMVEVPAEDVNSAIEKKLTHLSRQVKISGFRPGKVPLRVARQRFGERASQEVIEDIVRSSYQQAIIQKKLSPAGPPDIKSVHWEINEGKDLRYVATFEVYPEITLADESTYEIEVPEVEIAESDIDDVVGKLLKQKIPWDKVDRKAKKGDRVTLNFVGKIDGKEVEGYTREKFSVIVGSGDLLPDFEEQLVGVSEDDEKSFQVTFPGNAEQKDSMAEKVTFEIKVLKVEQGEVPELTEDLIKKFGIQDGTQASFRNQLRENMSRELEQHKKFHIKGDVMRALLDANEVQLPAVLVKQELQGLRQREPDDVQMTDSSSGPEGAVDGLLEKRIQKKLTLSLLMGEIVHKNEIKLDQARVTQHLQAISAGYAEPDEVIDRYRNNRERMSNIELMVIEEQIVDHVLRKAKTKGKKLGFKEFMSQQPQSI